MPSRIGQFTFEDNADAALYALLHIKLVMNRELDFDSNDPLYVNIMDAIRELGAVDCYEDTQRYMVYGIMYEVIDRIQHQRFSRNATENIATYVVTSCIFLYQYCVICLIPFDDHSMTIR
jgi:hypothetical protein